MFLSPKTIAVFSGFSATYFLKIWDRFMDSSSLSLKGMPVLVNRREKPKLDQTGRIYLDVFPLSIDISWGPTRQ
jgi:hypothetical protein